MILCVLLCLSLFLLRYVVVIIFTVAAILTPPDPITQVGLAIPLLLLYELSIITVRFTEKKDKKENVEDA